MKRKKIRNTRIRIWVKWNSFAFVINNNKNVWTKNSFSEWSCEWRWISIWIRINFTNLLLVLLFLFAYLISDNDGYSHIRNVFEFEPTEYIRPFGWNSAHRTACTSSNAVTATNRGRFGSFCGWIYFSRENEKEKKLMVLIIISQKSNNCDLKIFSA